MMTDPRYIDAEIAEHLLGYRWIDVGPDYDGENRCSVLVPNDVVWTSSGYNYPHRGVIHPAFHVPQYTERWEYTWHLALWMKEHGSSFTLNWGEDNDLWECAWISGGERFVGFSKDPGKAIIEAALQAARKRKEMIEVGEPCGSTFRNIAEND